MTLQTWIREEIERRGWSYGELARRAGLTASNVSMVMAEERRATSYFCDGIARALEVPPDRVFRLAGLLPAVAVEGEDAEMRQRLDDYWRYLDTDDRDVLVSIAQVLYEKAWRARREEGEEGER